MGHAAKPIRHNRTITVDFRDEATYVALLGTTKAFVEFVLAFLLALGLQRGWQPDAPLSLCPSPPGRTYHLIII